MKVKGFIGLLITLVSFLFLSCTPKEAPPTAPAAISLKEDKVGQVEAKEAWHAKWESKLSAARKEAKLYAYISLGAQERQAIENNFTKRYGMDI